MRKKLAIIGGIVTLALLVLSSTSIALANAKIEFGHDKDKRPQIPLMSFAHANLPSPYPHTYQAYQAYQAYQTYHCSYGDWHTSALNDKGKFQELRQLNHSYTNNTCSMNFSNEGNTLVNISYNVSVSSNHHLSGYQGKLALGAGESREISEDIAVKKDWRNLAFKSETKIDSSSNGNGTRTSMSFKLISWHSFSSMPNDPGEVDKDI